MKICKLPSSPALPALLLLLGVMGHSVNGQGPIVRTKSVPVKPLIESPSAGAPVPILPAANASDGRTSSVVPVKPTYFYRSPSYPIAKSTVAESTDGSLKVEKSDKAGNPVPIRQWASGGVPIKPMSNAQSFQRLELEVEQDQKKNETPAKQTPHLSGTIVPVKPMRNSTENFSGHFSAVVPTEVNVENHSDVAGLFMAKKGTAREKSSRNGRLNSSSDQWTKKSNDSQIFLEQARPGIVNRILRAKSKDLAVEKVADERLDFSPQVRVVPWEKRSTRRKESVARRDVAFNKSSNQTLDVRDPRDMASAQQLQAQQLQAEPLQAEQLQIRKVTQENIKRDTKKPVALKPSSPRLSSRKMRAPSFEKRKIEPASYGASQKINQRVGETKGQQAQQPLVGMAARINTELPQSRKASQWTPVPADNQRMIDSPVKNWMKKNQCLKVEK